MNTTYSAAGLGQTTVTTQCVSSFRRRCWVAFQKWSQRGRLQDELHNLSDRALPDIGVTRGEIEYHALNSPADTRGVRCRADKHV